MPQFVSLNVREDNYLDCVDVEGNRVVLPLKTCTAVWINDDGSIDLLFSDRSAYRITTPLSTEDVNKIIEFVAKI